MTTTAGAIAETALTAWLDGNPVRARVRGRVRCGQAAAGLRFAVYGRTSTSRQQDPATSREWQREDAVRVIDGRGRIVVEFFDIEGPPIKVDGRKDEIWLMCVKRDAEGYRTGERT